MPPHPPPLVAVAGATGWLGGHVVDALIQRGGVRVLALARPGTDTAALAAKAAPPTLTVARLDLTQPVAAEAVATALSSAAAGGPVAAVINCVGVRNLAIPDAAIKAVLTAGTLALWRGARTARAARFVSIAGGIHRLPDGRPNRAMVHNAAREAALDVAAAEANEATRLAVLDASVFFKDAQTIFEMVAKSTVAKATGTRTQPPSLTLIAGGWDVQCNPISGRDLAGALVAAALEGGDGGRPPVARRTVGGPEILNFGGLADCAAQALGWEACVRKTMPRWAARLAYGLARTAGAAGSVRALGLARFLSFLWVVCTDESPGGLVGEVTGGDRVSDLFAELGRGRQRAVVG